MYSPLTRIALALCLLLPAAACGDDDGDDNNNNNDNTTLCGNGTLDPNEECDGDLFGGETCEGLGYHGGPLRCTESCTLELSYCEMGGWCGDGYWQEPFEQCDGTDTAVMPCAVLDDDWTAGEVFCTDTCELSDALCSTCGDDTLSGTEICDDGNDVKWDGCNSCQVVEFRVDEDATAIDSRVQSALSDNGTLLVAYRVYWDDGGSNVYAQPFVQRFLATGEPEAHPIAVTPPSTDSIGWASVGVDAQGRFAVSYVDDPSRELRVKRFGANGQQDGTPIVVATLPGNDGSWSHLDMNDAGRFVVSWWAEDASDTDRGDVYFRLYDPSGSPVTDAVRMNDATGVSPAMASASISETGEVIATWTTESIPTTVWARGFSDLGVPLGAETLISGDSTDFSRFEVNVSGADDGRAVAIWMEYQTEPMIELRVFAQRLSASGAPEGLPILVVEGTNQVPYFSDVAVLGDGRFTVAWATVILAERAAIPSHLEARDFDAQGNPVGGVYRVSKRPGTHSYSASAAASGNRFGLFWVEVKREYANGDLYGQRFADQGRAIGLTAW